MDPVVSFRSLCRNNQSVVVHTCSVLHYILHHLFECVSVFDRTFYIDLVMYKYAEKDFVEESVIDHPVEEIGSCLFQDNSTTALYWIVEDILLEPVMALCLVLSYLLTYLIACSFMISIVVKSEVSIE